jgi:hypothetical protein
MGACRFLGLFYWFIWPACACVGVSCSLWYGHCIDMIIIIISLALSIGILALDTNGILKGQIGVYGRSGRGWGRGVCGIEGAG